MKHLLIISFFLLPTFGIAQASEISGVLPDTIIINIELKYSTKDVGENIAEGGKYEPISANEKIGYHNPSPEDFLKHLYTDNEKGGRSAKNTVRVYSVKYIRELDN